MFKYTPPWQVLSCSLRTRPQLVSGRAKAGQSLPVEQDTEGNSERGQQPENGSPARGQEAQASPEEDPTHEESQPAMDRVTRNLIYSIPRTQVHQEAVTEDGTHYTIETSWEDGYWDQTDPGGSQQAQENGTSVKNEYLITTVKSNSLERNPLIDYRTLSATPSRVSESYSLVRDPHRGSDVWVPSPDRDSKLELVRKGELYDLRAYREEEKPAKLFSENDEELEYRLVSVEVSPVKDLEIQRKNVIKEQAVRRSLADAKRWHSLDEVDSEPSNLPVTSRDSDKKSTSEFAFQYHSSESLEPDAASRQDNVDTEQINFLAARQQFMMLEKNKPDLLQGLKPQSRPPKLSDSNRTLHERDWYTVDGSPYAVGMAPDGSRQRAGDHSSMSSAPSMKEEMLYQERDRIAMADPEGGKTQHNLRHHVLITSSREDLNSGLGEMPYHFGAGYGSDRSPSQAVSGAWQDQELASKYETPIEREIRLAMEREEDLRKARGIQGSTTTEMVAVPKKPLLTESPPASPARKGKEKGRHFSYVQREIEKETKREDDMRSEGKVVGLYDKGPVEELEERKRRFEQEGQVPVFPIHPIHYKSPDSEFNERKAPLIPEAVLEQDAVVDLVPEVRRRNREQVSRLATEAYQPYLISSSDDSRARNVPSVYKSSLRNSWQPPSNVASQSPSIMSQEDSAKRAGIGAAVNPEEKFVLQKQYFNWKPWTPRLSPAAAPQSTPDTPQQSTRTSERISNQNVYTLKPMRSQAASLIEREIQEVLQREEELQQQRQKSSLLPEGYSRFADDRDSPFTPDSPPRHQESAGVPDTYVVSLFNVPFRPLVLKVAPDTSSDTVLRERSRQTYGAPQKGSMSSEWEPGTPRRLKHTWLEEFEDGQSRQRDEHGYAGIDPSDDVNNEIVESTRVNRRKSAMALRWEAGQYLNIQDD